MNTPRIRIYGLAPFDRGAKARWLLTELGVSYESRWLNRDTQENEKPDFLRLNPMGRVPVLEIDDQPMSESGAICSYLADRLGPGKLAPVPTAQDRAQYEQWMHFASATLDLIQMKIMIIEDIPAGKVRDEKESALLAETRDAMEALDRTLSKGPYLVSARFSAADICVGYHLYWLRLWPELDAVIRKFPRVTDYLDRLKEMPSAKKADVFSFKG